MTASSLYLFSEAIPGFQGNRSFKVVGKEDFSLEWNYTHSPFPAQADKNDFTFAGKVLPHVMSSFFPLVVTAKSASSTFLSTSTEQGFTSLIHVETCGLKRENSFSYTRVLQGPGAHACVLEYLCGVCVCVWYCMLLYACGRFWIHTCIYFFPPLFSKAAFPMHMC